MAESLSDRTTVATAERLAVVETEIKGLKDDTAVIRSTMHGFNNEMQKFVMAEQRNADSMETLKGQFQKFELHVETLLAARHRQAGAWASWAVAGAAVIGAVTIIGSVVFVIMEFLGRTPIRPP